MATASRVKGSSELTAELSVTGDHAGLQLVRTYVRELAALASLPDVDALLLAVQEACQNIVEAAFDPGAPGTIRVSASISPTALTLGIYELGLPLDESLAPLSGASDRSRLTAPGWHLLHHAVDEAHWYNHGREGSELRLIKFREQPDITEQLPAEALTPAAQDAPRAPEQEYTIRLLHPDEAVQVSQCIYRAYGYSYPNEDMYYPERIVQLNKTGQLISVVAVDAAGEVVGHIALERPDLGRVAESGQAVVMPAHRGRHIMERMRAFLEQRGREIGLVHVYSEPVTSHPYSQKANEEIGARVSGVLLGVAPRSMSFKKIRSEPLEQRESCMFYVKYLTRPAPVVVHAPAHHSAILEEIYAHLEAPAEFREPAPQTEQSRVEVSLDRAWGYGTIRVRSAGSRTASEVSQALRDLVATAGAEAVYLELPLSEPQTPYLVRAAEDEGFFFSGVAPAFADEGDVLRLQYLNVALDTARLQVASPFGKRIVEYAAAERERVS